MRPFHLGIAVLLIGLVAAVYVSWLASDGPDDRAEMPSAAPDPPLDPLPDSPTRGPRPPEEPPRSRADLAAHGSAPVGSPAGLTLEGVVLDPADVPVADFPLTLVLASGVDEGPPQSTSSDPSGRFRFSSLVPGRYRVGSARPGYAISRPVELNLGPDPPLTGLEVRVHPLVSITGRVFDEFGGPLPGVRVSTRGLVASELFVSDPGESDSDGFFEIQTGHDLRAAASMAELAAAFSQHQRADFDVDARLAADVCIVFEHPGFRTVVDSIQLDPPPVDVGGVFMMRSRIQLEGRVTNRRNQPVASTLTFHSVESRQASGASEARGPEADPATRCADVQVDVETVSDTEGRFAIGLEQAGRYEVRVKPRHSPPHFVVVDLDGASSPVSIRLD